jgi:hypothetical protein
LILHQPMSAKRSLLTYTKRWPAWCNETENRQSCGPKSLGRLLLTLVVWVSDSGGSAKWLVCCGLVEPIYSCNNHWTPSPSLKSLDRLVYQPYAPTRQEMPRRMAVAEYFAREASWATCSFIARYSSRPDVPSSIVLHKTFCRYTLKTPSESLLYRASFSCSAVPELAPRFSSTF